ncbi:MAG: acylphosphatase [Minisyncoccia bacterium]
MFSEIHCIVKGKVQGVGYRDFVEHYAKEHSLNGWIKNNADGSVESVIQGTPDELKICIESLNQGSLLAKVESMSVDWRTPAKQFSDFSVRSS